jgi:hypothetical protein
LSEPAHYFNLLQSNTLKWIAIALISIFLASLVVIMNIAIYRDFDGFRAELMPHIVVIMGLAGMGLSSVLLVAIFRQADGPIEVEAIGIKFKGGAGPIVLWIMAFLAMVGGSRMLWLSN